MAERKYTIREETLFQPASVAPVYLYVTPLTLGLIKAYRLGIDEDKVYIVDAGFNDVFVYDRASVGHRQKYFWKLNIDENPVLKVQWIPKRFDIAVEVPDIPSFDPEFGQRGGWIKMKYNVRVQLEVSRGRVHTVHEAVNPLTTVRNAVLRTARRILPLMSYQEAMIATAEESILQHIQEDSNVQSTGLNVTLAEVEGIEGSKELSQELQQSFTRLLEAGDKRDMALQLASMDKEVFQRMLESDAPQAALEYRSRAANQMLEALLASGRSLPDIVQMSGWAAREIKQPDVSLPKDVAMKALQQMEEPPPLPAIPETATHEERLRWERKVVEEQFPMQLQKASETSDTFIFRFDTGDELKIIWWTPDAPPEVLINDKDRRLDYPFLSSGLYDYNKTTVRDIFWETRKLIGVADDEPST